MNEFSTNPNSNYVILTNQLIDLLEKKIKDEMILNSFVRGIEIVSIDKKRIEIETKTKDAHNFIVKTYSEEVESILGKLMKKKVDVVFFVSKGKNTSGFAPQNIKRQNGISKKYSFDNYVEAGFNEETIRIAKKTLNRRGVFSPFFVTSNSGLGKTHLLNALGNEFSKNGVSCFLVEPNFFTQKITDYSKIGGNAIRKYIDHLCGHEVLLFDDIQNLGDRSVTLRVFLEILNIFNENDKQIIIASDKIPRELSGFEERFITRFSSGLTSIISQPSNEDLIKILNFKLKEKNLSPERWEREAIRFIVRNNSQSIRSIEGAVKRVSFYLEDAENIKYTHTVISNLFKRLSINPSELTHQRIIGVVGEYYKISKGDIIGKGRKAEIIMARHMAIWMVRKLLLLPFKKIGRIFGNRDHSTIMSSIRNMDRKMTINSIIKAAAEKIEKKIKSVS